MLPLMEDNNMKFIVYDTPEFMDKPVTEFDMSVRTHNVLKRNGMETVRDIIDNWYNIPKFKNCGFKSIREIRSLIFEWNLEYMNESQLNKYADFFVKEN